MLVAALALLVSLLAGCAVSPAATSPLLPSASAGASIALGEDLRYVALGDSYTIGTSVAQAERFPDQLVEALGDGSPGLSMVSNLGVNGYTSGDLIREELAPLDALAPDFVTVLIGVNDVVQGVPAERYEANVVVILETLLVWLPAQRIVAVAIPDYTVTPAGANFGDPSRQSAGIAENNAIMARLAGERGIAFVDIFDISREAASDRSLVASDGLHPSGTQYARWVERLKPVVKSLLGQ